MKLAQEAAYIITIIVIVVQWVSKDKSSTEIDPLEPLEDTEFTHKKSPK